MTAGEVWRVPDNSVASFQNPKDTENRCNIIKWEFMEPQNKFPNAFWNSLDLWLGVRNIFITTPHEVSYSAVWGQRPISNTMCSLLCAQKATSRDCSYIVIISHRYIVLRSSTKFPFSRWRCWGPKRMSDFHKVINEERGRSSTGTAHCLTDQFFL